MALKYLLPVIALTAAAAVTAEEYQVFTGLNVDHTRFSGSNETNWQLNGQYFFDKKQTLGPLDQFEYINRVTNVKASANRAFGENGLSVGGEYFIDNKFMVSAGIERLDGDNNLSAGIGYLISDNFIVKAEIDKQENVSASYVFSASYNHQLADNDYIGFSAQTDEEFDVYGVSSKYFAALADGRYVAAGVSIVHADSSTYWEVDADYYFSKMTSVGVSYNKVDTYKVAAKHYFDQNWALQFAYSGNTEFSSLKMYSVGVIGQF